MCCSILDSLPMMLRICDVNSTRVEGRKYPMKLVRAISVSLFAFFFPIPSPQDEIHELIMWDEQMMNTREPWKNSG